MRRVGTTVNVYYHGKPGNYSITLRHDQTGERIEFTTLASGPIFEFCRKICTAPKRRGRPPKKITQKRGRYWK